MQKAISISMIMALSLVSLFIAKQTAFAELQRPALQQRSAIEGRNTELQLTAKQIQPVINDFLTEIKKAKGKVREFDAASGRDLYHLTVTKLSIPAMISQQNSMKGILGEAQSKMGIVIEELVAKNNSLLKILKSQQGNTNDPRSAMNALNEMENILHDMEKMLH